MVHGRIGFLGFASNAYTWVKIGFDVWWQFRHVKVAFGLSSHMRSRFGFRDRTSLRYGWIGLRSNLLGWSRNRFRCWCCSKCVWRVQHEKVESFWVWRSNKASLWVNRCDVEHNFDLWIVCLVYEGPHSRIWKAKWEESEMLDSNP